MGCDIHAYAERKTDSGYEYLPAVVPFDWRNYGVFGFLAGVRNYSSVPMIAEPRGFPDDASAEVREQYERWDMDAHTPSWLSMAELLAWDYNAEVEDRRVTRNGNGACTCEPGEGERMTWRQFLGDGFMKDIAALRDAGADRVVFWFDN